MLAGIPLPLEKQIHYATDFFQGLVLTYQCRRFPKTIFKTAMKGWRTDVGIFTITDCLDGVDYLITTGKIRAIEETSEIEITDKFDVQPKGRLEIDFDRELSNRYQAELKKLEVAHGLLYQFENALRQFVADTLSSVDKDWVDSLVEKNTAEKWKSVRQAEKEYAWLRPVEQDLIYYSDLRDLVQTINKNWDQIFSKKLGRRFREALVSRIAELEPIRNIVAHNRQVSDEALKRLEMLWDDFSSVLPMTSA